MIRMTLADVVDVVAGRLEGAPATGLVTGASSDSRDLTNGALFVAVRGERTDGHDHAADAVAAGAVAALVSRPVPGVPCVVVDDPVEALGRVARHVLMTLRRQGQLSVIAITGSSGKTTTKDMLASILRSAGTTIAPRGSFNTEVTLPVTVLRADEHTRYLVLEMSARGIGHIEYLAGIAPPDVGVVLNVGTAHVGEFGSREVVAAAKGELVAGIRPFGIAVLNADDPAVLAMRDRRAEGVSVRTFGTAPGTDATVADVRIDGLTTRFEVSGVPFLLPVPGRHLALDAAAAALAAQCVGVDFESSSDALREWRDRSRWRMEVTRAPSGATVINDAYNANPESMDAAIDALLDVAAGRRTWAVLGGMAELGAETQDAHVRLGERCREAAIDHVVVVGELARPILLGCPDAVWVPDAEAAVGLLHDRLDQGDVVLVKASRSVELQRVALALAPDVSQGGPA